MAELRSCPCCGYHTLYTLEPGSFEACSICFWEDDPVQSQDPDYEGGANHPSLRQAQRNFREFGACDRDALPHVRPPTPADRRDPNYSPLE